MGVAAALVAFPMFATGAAAQAASVPNVVTATVTASGVCTGTPVGIFVLIEIKVTASGLIPNAPFEASVTDGLNTFGGVDGTADASGHLTIDATSDHGVGNPFSGGDVYEWDLYQDPATAPTAVSSGTLTLGNTDCSAFTTSTYVPLTPSRILDSRSGTGAPKAALGPGRTLGLQVAGNAGVPASGVSAVVLNVTVTSPTAASYLTVYPSGAARPTTSNLNFVAGWTGANNVTVKLGGDGKVDVYNHAGSTQVIADVVGYYQTDNSTGGSYFPLTTEKRILDTRATVAVAAHGTVIASFDASTVNGSENVNQHVAAFAVNVTAVAPTTAGYLTAWSGDGSAPNASTLNFAKGVTVANLAILPTNDAGNPSISVTNASGSPVNVIVDLFGFYDDGTLTGGLRFRPITPTRIVDTRTHQGSSGPIGNNATATFSAAAVTDAKTVALDMNVTAIAPTTPTFLTVWPTSGTRPTVSNLNPPAGATVANGVLTSITGNQFNIYNNAGSTPVAIDVDGLFESL